MPEVSLLKGVGVEGDFHQGGGRQISLLAAEARRWMEVQSQKGFCFGRFRENMLIEGLPINELKSGALLSVGSAVLRIGSHRKRCYDECALSSKDLPCRLMKSVCFADVAQSGTVRMGDVVSVRSPLCMTRGSYDG